MARENLIYNQQYIIKRLMELAYDGIVVVDAEGIIILISKVYTDFLGICEKDAIGRHVNDVIENTRLPEVLKSGKTETAQLQQIKGSYMIASRFPMIREGKVIGAIGKVLFKNIDELNVLHRRIANLQQQLKDYQHHAGGRAKYSFASIIGESGKLRLAKVMAENAGMTDSNVLLLGESGTGKELFAHAIHQASPRSGNAFIKVNCAAIPAELLESELFGYEEGAFTGARKGGKAGKFELADCGTLFLDEIGDMPAGMQAKLLRALQEKEIEKIGAKYPLKVDVRIIAATNQDLERLVADGRFRADLFYRLNVVAIKIPALRERPDDINQLAPYLLEKICAHLGKYVDEISAQASLLLKRHHWPGNVRELENALERAVNLIGSEGVIMPKHLPQEIGGGSSGGVEKLAMAVENAERRAIEQALKSSRGKKARAARLLGISRSGLYKLIDKLNM